MANTPITKLRYLRENDVSNVSSVNHNLSRLDALTTLVLQSTTVTAEPTSPSLGQCWAVDVAGSPTGNFWGTITEDSILMYVLSGEGEAEWQAVPAWAGAYAYVVDAAQFQAYSGSSWSRPSKRKVLNITLTKETIEQFDGPDNVLDNWLPLIRVESDHVLVQAHMVWRARRSAFSKGSPEEIEAQELLLPYSLPKLVAVTDRTVVPSADDVILSGVGSGAVEPSSWNIPTNATADGNEQSGKVNPYSVPSYAAYSTGLSSVFSVGKAVSISGGAASNGLSYTAGTFPFSAGTEIPYLTFFGWINVKNVSTRNIISYAPSGVATGFEFKIVDDPGSSGKKVLQWQFGRGSRTLYATASGSYRVDGDGFGSYTPPPDGQGAFSTTENDEWVHVGFNYVRNRAVYLFVNGQRIPVHHNITRGGASTNNWNREIDLEWPTPQTLEVGSGDGSGMDVDEFKMYYQNIFDSAVDYNGGKSLAGAQPGFENDVCFRLSGEETTGANQYTTPTEWWTSPPTITNATVGETPGVGSASSFDSLPVIPASGGQGYVLANFNDFQAGNNGLTLDDVEDVTIQLVYTGVSSS